MARSGGDGIKVDSTPENGRRLDGHNPHVRDFTRPNDALGKQLRPSAENALQKMFNINGNDEHIRADGLGKITRQQKDTYGNPIGHAQVYDVKELRPEIAKDLEYHLKRHIVSEHTGISVEDLNNVREVNGEYHFKDKDGDNYVERPDEEVKKAIDLDISSLGLDNNKQHISDSVGKGILEHAANQEAKSETDPVKQQALKDKINNGAVHSYEYDKKNDQYKFYIRQEGKDHPNGTGKLDGEIKEVAIDSKSLTSEVKKGLEYHEAKNAAKDAYGLEKIDVHDFRVADNKVYFTAKDGETTYRFDSDPSRMKNIKDHLAEKGFNYNEQQISNSVENAVIQHAIGKETDPAKKDAKEKALEGAKVYDYTYDKGKKEHVYHVLTKEEHLDADGETELRDGAMERVSFTADEHKKLLEDATINAVRKYGELPDGAKITNDMEVDFVLNDKTKFLVKDHGIEYTLTGDSGSTIEGEDLSTAIKKELDVKLRANPDDILTGKKPEVLVGTKGTDSEADLEDEKAKRFDYWRGWRKWGWEGAAMMNDGFLNAAQSVESVAAQMVHAAEGNQQPQQSQATHELSKHMIHSAEQKSKMMHKHAEITRKAENAKKGMGGSLEAGMVQKVEDLKNQHKLSKRLNSESGSEGSESGSEGSESGSESDDE